MRYTLQSLFLTILTLLNGCTFGPKSSWAYIGTLEPVPSHPEKTDEKSLIVGVPTGKKNINWHAASFYIEVNHYEIKFKNTDTNNQRIIRIDSTINGTKTAFLFSEKSKILVRGCSAQVNIFDKSGAEPPGLNGIYDMSDFSCLSK